MNLKDLYTATPVARHADIVVREGFVYLKDADGDLQIFVLDSDQNLWSVPAQKDFKDVLRQLRTVLIHLHNDIEAMKATNERPIPPTPLA